MIRKPKTIRKEIPKETNNKHITTNGSSAASHTNTSAPATQLPDDDVLRIV